MAVMPAASPLLGLTVDLAKACLSLLFGSPHGDPPVLLVLTAALSRTLTTLLATVAHGCSMRLAVGSDGVRA
jgi:hypothetical protein